jgi:putative transposase
VWADDFVHDACANGQKLKCLTVIDEFTRECLAIDVAGSIRSARVIDVLARLISAHGAPAFLRSDNGPEFVSEAILEWLAEAKIDTALIDPGNPWQNGDNELQRQISRRMPEHGRVSQPHRSPCPHRNLAPPLQ